MSQLLTEQICYGVNVTDLMYIASLSLYIKSIFTCSKVQDKLHRTLFLGQFCDRYGPDDPNLVELLTTKDTRPYISIDLTSNWLKRLMWSVLIRLGEN